MKLLILPLLVLLSIFSSAVSAVANDSLDSSVSAAALNSTQSQSAMHTQSAASDHCATLSQSTLNNMVHSSGSMPMDCSDSFECCAQLCYSQLQLNLNYLVISQFVPYSYIPQYHSFSLVQGVNTPIERPPKA